MKRIYILPLLFAAASCDVAMPSDIGKEPLLYVECLPGLSDTTAIQLLVTAPAFGFSESGIPSQASLSLSVDGRPLSLENAPVREEGFPVGAWYTKTSIPKGALLELRASAPGLPPVSASTRIPEPPEDFEVNVGRTTVFDGMNSPEEALRLSVTFSRAVSRDSYFGLMVECRNGNLVRWTDFAGITSEGNDITFYPEHSQVAARLTKWAFSDSWALGELLVLWQATDLKDLRELEAWTYYNETYYPEGCEFRFHVFRASPEFYRYARSRQMGDPEESLAPLLPSSYAFNNIRGGCGVFGGLSESVSDWIRL